MAMPRRSVVVRSVALVFAVLLPSAAHADGPLAALVKDIVAGGSSSLPGASIGSEGTAVVISDVLFFTANNATSGAELWKSDGTAAGTVLVKDIAPGALASFPLNLTNVNGTLFFFANDGILGHELWKSDGTAAGTVLVKDIVTGPGSGMVALVLDRAVKDGVLYFGALHTTHGYELWRKRRHRRRHFHGERHRARRGHGLLPGISAPVNVNGTLFFAANDGVAGLELWSSDGTSGGTTLVGDIASGMLPSNPTDLTDVNGVLMFMASDGSTTSLWRFNGTDREHRVGRECRQAVGGCRIVFGGLLYSPGLRPRPARSSGSPTARRPAPCWSRTSSLVPGRPVRAGLRRWTTRCSSPRSPQVKAWSCGRPTGPRLAPSS